MVSLARDVGELLLQWPACLAMPIWPDLFHPQTGGPGSTAVNLHFTTPSSIPTGPRIWRVDRRDSAGVGTVTTKCSAICLRAMNVLRNPSNVNFSLVSHGIHMILSISRKARFLRGQHALTDTTATACPVPASHARASHGVEGPSEFLKPCKWAVPCSSCCSTPPPCRFSSVGPCRTQLGVQHTNPDQNGAYVKRMPVGCGKEGGCLGVLLDG